MNDSLIAWMKDTAERTIFTFLQSFLGLILVSASESIDGLSLSVIETAAVSGVVSALAVLKAAVASYRQGISPASFLGSEEA